VIVDFDGLKVGVKKSLLVALKLFALLTILIGAYDAPIGTVTVSDVADAETTVALTLPKNIILLLFVTLKLLPVIVTVVPTNPDLGIKLDMLGTCALNIRLENKIVMAKMSFRIMWLALGFTNKSQGELILFLF
jgi:hypothetical protein